MALALVEAGARAVYCLDLPGDPGEEWEKVAAYAKKLEGKTGGAARLEYVSADVTDQVRCAFGFELSFGCGAGGGEDSRVANGRADADWTGLLYLS